MTLLNFPDNFMHTAIQILLWSVDNVLILRLEVLDKFETSEFASSRFLLSLSSAVNSIKIAQ